MNVARHLVIRGRVQGVGYRAFVEDAALDHGLTGWVRNRRNGAVTHACRRGPPGARVDGIDERQATAEELALGGGVRFAVLPTV